MKKIMCALGLIAGLSYSLFASAAACSGKVGVYEAIYNDTGKPLVASTFMSNNMNGNDFPLITNVSAAGNFQTITKGDVTIDSNGNMFINNACGNGDSNYDIGISIGPYHIFSQKGTWPDWSNGVDKNYLNYHLFTKRWNNDSSPYSWSIYAPGGVNNYTLTPQVWYDKYGEAACRDATSTSVCIATDIKDCNTKNLCNTWVIVHIHNLGTAPQGPLARPLGKF